MISILIPTHDIPEKDFFLKRALDSIASQTYKDYEIVITNEGTMAKNINEGMKRCKGEIIKLLCMDDYLAHPNALENIAQNIGDGWVATGCAHVATEDVELYGQPVRAGELFNDHYANYGERQLEGYNEIGGLSVISFPNENHPEFDENLSWLIDVVFYQQLVDRFGMPVILDDINVIIGLGAHQTTHVLDNSDKSAEEKYVKEKYL
jgi:glycosyltransferase involved in cell wall biosynthesis